MTQHSHTLLLGYVGKGNFGDDIMVDAVARALSGPDPSEDYQVISGREPLWRLIPKLLRTRRVIVCGGHVVNARTGSYLRVLTLAKLCGCHLSFFSIEVSGWPPARAGRMQRWVMSGARISTRTFASRAILLQQLPTAEVINVIDAFYLHPAFAPCVDPPGPVQLGRFLFDPGFELTAEGTRDADATVFVLARSFPDGVPYSENANIARIATVLGEIAPPGCTRRVVVSPSARVDSSDRLCKALAGKGHRIERLGADAPLRLTPASHVITNRLHIAKLCAFVDVPFTLVSYDTKTERPELVGENGTILQLSGARIGAREIALTRAQFKTRLRLSQAVLTHDTIV